MLSLRHPFWIWILLLALSILCQSSIVFVTAAAGATGSGERFPTSLLRLSTGSPLMLASAKTKTKPKGKSWWRKTEESSKEGKEDDDEPSDTSSTSESKNDEKEDTSSDADSKKEGKSWKESRKPISDKEKKNNSSKKGFTRFSMPIFGMTKKDSEKAREESIEGSRQSERAKRQQERKEKAEKQKEEKMEKQKIRQSRFAKAKEARKERSKKATNKNNTTNIAPTNETAVDAATSANVTSTNTTTVPKASPPQQTPSYPTGYVFGNQMGNQGGGAPILYRPGPPPRQQQQALNPQQALAVTAILSVLSVLSRLYIVVWITKQLGWEEDMVNPVQHFVWECLNDRYTKDESVLAQALSRTPAGYTKRQWKKYLKSSIKQPKDTTKQKMSIPGKTTVVVNITPNNQLDLSYLSDVVNFLTKVHASSGFGSEIEVVLLLRSPGGSVTTYGLAAAQVARLEQAGMNTTVCVDDVAASGGYMIASQTAKIVAAPFAMVGSIGVIAEGLNFNKILEKYGVTPMVLKAGDNKNRISTLGPVSQKDIKEEEKRLEEVHQSFIELCRNQRPMLDPSVCDGTVLIGDRAVAYGMVDRVLTSDEYIWERICDGDYVLKLHRTHSSDQRRMFARALDVLPHLRQQIRNLDMQKLIGRVLQGISFASMLRSTLFKGL